MKCSKPMGWLLAISSIIASPLFAATIPFEELGDFSGVAPIGVIGGIDFGSLSALNTKGTSQAYLAYSPSNAAYFSPRLQYDITTANGLAFDFLGASFVRSYAEGDMFILSGWRNEAAIYSRYLETGLAITSSETPRFYDFDWIGIDKLTVAWSSINSPCCSTGYALMDNFTYQLSSTVPEPNALVLSLSGLCALIGLKYGNAIRKHTVS